MEIRALLSAMWRNRVGPILVAAQIAVTLAVIVNVAYVVKVRMDTVSQPTGIDTDNMFWVVSLAHTPEFIPRVAIPADVAWLQSLPGVVAAANANMVPQGFNTTTLAFSPDPAVLEKGGGEPAILYVGTGQLVQTLGVKLIKGRTFDDSVVPPPSPTDSQAADWGPEVVITKNLADKLFPKGDALGKTLHVGLVNRSATIVGIIEYMQHQPWSGPGAVADIARTVAIFPATAGGSRALYIVRTQPGRRDAVMAQVEKEFADRQPGRYIASMESVADSADRQRRGMRTSAVTLSIVAAFVVLVTVVGIVGLAAFTVATRTKQLGTRRAIGATKFHILRYFLIENWLITSVGALIGCALGLAVGIQLSTMYRMPQLPLWYLAGGVLALWALGLLSVWLPARRAAAISPATATRTV